jgi:putative addiction module antidote
VISSFADYNLGYNLTTYLLVGPIMAVLKVTTVGNSVGVILPKELLERLRVGKGDSLYVIETKQGIELTPYNPEFARQIEAAERVMREDRDALRKLAE